MAPAALALAPERPAGAPPAQEAPQQQHAHARAPRPSDAGPHGAAAPASAQPPPYDPRIAGVWVKDASKSDKMDAAMDAMALGGIKRRAIALVRGLELSFRSDEDGTGGGTDEWEGGSDAGSGDEGEPAGGARPGQPAAAAAAAAASPRAPAAPGHTRFTFAVFSALPLLRVREHYALGGPPSSLRRRDLRGGRAEGAAAPLPGGALEVRISWPPPHAGRGRDEVRVVEGEGGREELVVESLLTMDDDAVAPVRCKTVYRRVR
ncbi:MAG: hypothetical protein J3K34DRAFT_525009 [Monoraphidium minutum]|nr:MAG: hypothetical protein J3K34DRAFT_525009 [Monoraphidium minutum]